VRRGDRIRMAERRARRDAPPRAVARAAAVRRCVRRRFREAAADRRRGRQSRAGAVSLAAARSAARNPAGAGGRPALPEPRRPPAQCRVRRRTHCPSPQKLSVRAPPAARGRRVGRHPVPVQPGSQDRSSRMNILMLSVGGGGGHILRSVKALFRRDLATVQKSDPRYAERLRRAVVTRFLDTNEFSVSDIPAEERVIIGAQTTGRLGSRHDPDVARRALDESRAEVEALLKPYAVVILIGTGGKGTGAGTLLPIARMARDQRKLVIPIFVRPSFEWHEVEKRRYDHALTISEQFDLAGIRLIEILNDRGYSSANPQPQQTVWEQMNRPIARALRGLLYVLSDLSQVDPSDLSMLFAGPGRLRVGFAEIDPQPGADPTDDEVRRAVDMCWENPYSLFSKPVGTSLICIHGQWSNLVDGRIKGGLASLATAGPGPATYNPLHAFAPAAPKPWGVTALFAEYTGNHPPLQ